MITMTLANTALLDASDCRSTTGDVNSRHPHALAARSLGYLWFLDQLQQVFNMLSQQILALPHLIQSSERIKQRASVETLTGPVCVWLFDADRTHLTALVSRVAYR